MKRAPPTYFNVEGTSLIPMGPGCLTGVWETLPRLNSLSVFAVILAYCFLDALFGITSKWAAKVRLAPDSCDVFRQTSLTVSGLY